jgi:hypothetical protein
MKSLGYCRPPRGLATSQQHGSRRRVARDEQFRSSLGCRVCPLQGLQNIVPKISRGATAAVEVLSPLTSDPALNLDIRLAAVDESLCESDEFRIGRAAATAQLVQEYV